MLKLRAALLAMIAALTLNSISIPDAMAQQLGIVTGGKSGTYIKIGRDLRQMLRTEGITLDVHPSQGSLENVKAVYEEPHAQMGIVQSDVLAFIDRMSQDPQLGKFAKKIRLMYPLYNEEVHILASSRVRDFDDLQGRSVAVGGENSGTFMTASLILKTAGLDVQQRYLSGGDALTALKRGEIDAMFYVAGYPVSLFETEVDRNDDFKLLEIRDKNVLEIYDVVSTIPRGTYPFQNSPLSTVAVKAALVTFDYKWANCKNIGLVGKALENNIDWLKANGHPKWQEVNLSLQLRGWDQYGCIDSNGRTAPSPNNSNANELHEAIRNIIKGN